MRFSSTLPATLLTALLLILAAFPLAAQDKCKLTDSPADCYKKFIGSTVTEGATEVTKETLNRFAASADSEDQSVSSNLKNSWQLLEVLGLVNTGETNNDGSLKIDFNRLLPSSWTNVGAQLEGLLNTTPEIFEPLKTALPEDGREEALAGLAARVKDGTDITVSLTFDVLNKNIGRDLKAWRPIYAELLGGAVDRAMGGINEPSLARVVDQFAADDDNPDIDFETSFIDMAKKKHGETLKAKEQANEWLANFEQAMLAETNLEKLIDSELASIDLTAFTKLLNNQPQLYFSASHRFRDELVGQEETKAKLTWELPMAPNVNRLRKYCEEPKRGENMEKCLPAYTQRIKDNLKASHRFSFSAEYVDTRDLSIDLPDLDFSKTFEGGHKLVASAGWGRQIGLDEAGNATSRFDLMISYEDISDPNPDLRVDNRWLASLNFSQKIGAVSIPLSIVYSNKSEFLAMQDLDEQISAHVGFKFTAN